MGSCLSTADVPQQAVTKDNKNTASRDSGERKKRNPAVDASLAYFDAIADPKEVESIRSQFRGTVYFDSLLEDEINTQSEEPEDESSFRYAPAQVANPHPRATIRFAESATLLQQQGQQQEDTGSSAATTTKNSS